MQDIFSHLGNNAKIAYGEERRRASQKTYQLQTCSSLIEEILVSSRSLADCRIFILSQPDPRVCEKELINSLMQCSLQGGQGFHKITLFSFRHSSQET